MLDRPSRYYDEDEMRSAVAAGDHRGVVGGMWHEIGELQREFLIRQGLRPAHRLLDVGCGTFRAGVKLVPYLEPGNYYGIDVSAELVEAGYERELVASGLAPRLPRANLAVNGDFDVSSFGVEFDYAIAQSLFTHLPLAFLSRCLDALCPHVAKGGVFFSTWFVCPDPSHDHPEVVQPHGVRTYSNRDLFHASVREIMAAAHRPGWRPVWIGEWGHPREQRMLAAVRL